MELSLERALGEATSGHDWNQATARDSSGGSLATRPTGRWRRALGGARRPEQLEAIKEVGGWSLTKTDFAAIDAILRESIRNPVGPEFMAPPVRQMRRVA